MIVLITILFGANLFIGSVNIPIGDTWKVLTGQADTVLPSWRFIIAETRLPQALTALLCGMALSASGLMLQTVFRNPLAGPSILGIDSGASLGAASIILINGSNLMADKMMASEFLTITAAAFIGAMTVIGLLLFFSTVIQNDVMLLIVGIMIGYASSSIISLLNFFSTAEGVHSYMVWGMGSFSGVSMAKLPYFALLIIAGISCSLSLAKPLNTLLLGFMYAENLGINIRRTRFLLLLTTGMLSAATTAFCGPISFLGLAVPHIARMQLRRADHRQLMPLSLLTGGAIALFCNLLCTLPGNKGIIPLNVVTPLLGIPVILCVLLNRRN